VTTLGAGHVGFNVTALLEKGATATQIFKFNNTPIALRYVSRLEGLNFNLRMTSFSYFRAS
jgi:hypothetical protein